LHGGSGGNLVFDPAKAVAFGEDVARQAQLLFGSLFATAIERVMSPTDRTVRFNVWLAAGSAEAGSGLGTAHRVDFENGEYSPHEIRKSQTILSSAEQNFRLSEALNEIPSGHVDIYLDRLFEGENEANPNGDFLRQDLVNTVQDQAGELGHHLGLVHTNSRDPAGVTS
jgi:hypothetical protein